MVRRFLHGSSALPRFALGVFALLLLVTAAPRAASAQTRGPLVVLGLRAPDGDDEAAANVTIALRRAARTAGFQVPETSPALEALVAQFSCPDSVPAACLQQIAGDVHAEQMVYGSIRREGRGRSAPLRIEVGLYSNGTVRMADPVQVARATTMDSDSSAPTARRLIDTLLPAPAAATPVASGPTAPEQTTPGRPVPIRRYIGIGVAALGAVGVVLGIVNVAGFYGLQGEQNTPGHAWYDYQPTDAATGAFIPSGDQLCTANDMNRPNQNPAGNGTYSQAMVSSVCGSARDQSMQAWVWTATGVALIGAGLVLIFTDNSDAAPAHASRDTRGRNRAARGAWALTPVVSPTLQGASFQMTF